jgi:hypothetical protein
MLAWLHVHNRRVRIIAHTWSIYVTNRNVYIAFTLTGTQLYPHSVAGGFLCQVIWLKL